ncbi:Regulator of protease activity HflC, stomatin/prohibitin superfamily [Actinopolyspora lacussalsi subsp. righensis]|uniref:Regulator of protease activity HflC, stomatin/prohibitin superfamily n=1 Tax=Actinopolyspora righensis TaxID=995060 RepID=A0A1I7AGQ3_9ACTN|nr:slipin family protein [Actinopolyspora righensis]SFT74078.1 Regulator of protease activity HflC, stomatin/prohibitin superfamily [Actinopolyspora righensis]
MIIEVLIGVLVVLALVAASSVRIIRQYERGVVLRFGRLQRTVRPPGLTAIMPGVDRLRKVNMQIITMPVPGQEGITRDNVTVKVDAVVYFNVTDPARAVINVEDYLFAMGQVAQASLRSIIGKSDLDDLLSDREKLNQGLEVMIDSPALNWGVHIDRVEIKDVSLPEAMKRSIARQAEAERERRSRIISADGEFQASRKLSEAAAVMGQTPAALQLRLLETVVEVAAEKNSTLVLPFPVELLRFVDRTRDGATEAAPAAMDTSGNGHSRAEDGGETEQRRSTAEEWYELPDDAGGGVSVRTSGVEAESPPHVPEQRDTHERAEESDSPRAGPTG